MSRLTSGMVALCALLVAAGCNGDATDPLRNGIDKIVAAPSQLFIELNATKSVDIGAVDEQGNALEEDYQVTSLGSGITVKRDSSFRGEFLNDSTFAVPPTATQFRFTVNATAYGATSFTVSAGGKDVVIPVQVIAQNQIAATFDNPTPALGDTVTITAPAGNTFTQTAALHIGANPDSLNPLIVERDPNGAFIKFIAPPNVNGSLTITEVISSGAPGFVFSPATVDLLTTPLFDTVDVTYSTATPTLGQAVTATIDNPLIKFRPEIASSVGRVRFGINFPGQLPGPLLGPDSLHVRSGAGPQNVTVAADSASLTFQAPPNANGSGSVVSFVFPGGFALALPTRTGITAPNIGTTLNTPINPANPATLQAVTINAPAGFSFGALATDSVTIGGQLAINQSLGAGGSSITVIPIPGSSGVATISGVSPSAAPQFVLTMNTTGATSAPAITQLVGTDDPATAPEITIPTAGNSVTVNDVGSFAGPGDCCFGFSAQFYKITIAAPTTLTFTLDWFQGQDLGVYLTQADGVTVINAGDNNGEGPTGHPETVTQAFAPGTYFAAIPNFSATSPSFFSLTVSNP